jgi:3-methyl-2-oxobutanoate hydroxymethyltransferase
MRYGMAQGGPQKPDSGRVTTRTFRRMKQEGRKIAVLTAYDFPTARIMDQAGIDCILVGDSAGTVVAGHKNTLPITMDEMIFLCRAVMRGVERALVIGDMPFMSFQPSEEEAIKNAGRFLKEGGVQAVKLEGGSEVAPLVKRLVDFGVPVMGHIGLTPQSLNKFGGYLVMGKTERQQAYFMRSAQDLQDAGCFAIVLESMLPDLAQEISESLKIPTIGIGAGVGCDGQVLVISDMIGLFEEFRPRFVRAYANVADVIRKAVTSYIDDVKESRFPDKSESYG